ncbi:S-adenosyl-L-methionine-dependent methyltransferase [Scheffersomyces coipomensis]|uniref:S-adenosyl-L-methionine-dependent methyltransferase n=1 Tax=Scheffersomyces coipomensis TaxID=1788519 RepID=UPI00315D261D
MVGKEQALLNYLLALPKLESIRGNAPKLLKVIDEYVEKHHYMNVGPLKGEVIINEIRKVKPKTMIELGGYFGYSAVLFANELPPDDNTAKYYSFELNPEFANIARQVVDIAGLSDKVEIIVGPAAKSLVEFESKLSSGKGYKSVDFVFIDHWKDKYVPDLRVLESLNLLAPGTLIAADNIYTPGVPEYVKYVQGSPEDRKEFNYKVPNDSGKEFLGRWNILYDSKTVPVQEANRLDAVEITKVVEYLNG